MRSIVFRLAAGAATFLGLLGISAGSASGDQLVETVYGDYYVPTRYSYATPTRYSYVAPTSYSYVPTNYSYVAPSSYTYVPTNYSYVAPTSYSYVMPASYSTTAYSYLPTSYSSVTPTYYETTYYRRPGLLRRLASRPVIETTRSYRYDVLPTTYYAPTTIAYDAPLTARATGYSPCEETSAPFNPPPASGAAAETSKSITSVPKNKDPIEPTYKEPAEEKAKAAEKPPAPVIAPDKDAPGTGGLEPSNAPPVVGDPKDRSAFRPVYTDMRPRIGNTSSLPMLRGQVLSGVNGDAKEGLRVVFSDLKQTFPDKEKTTDAKGAFEIFLPRGGWSMRVVDPKAADPKTGSKDYGQIISTEGRYLDENDSPIYGLRLSY